MTGYVGPFMHDTGIHRPLSRETLAKRLREIRALYPAGRTKAREYRDWLIWLGTTPLKPASDHAEWSKRVQNQTRAFLARIEEQETTQ